MLVVLAALSACAASPASVSPAYVSLLTYQHFTCEQLSAEAQALGYRWAELNTELTKRRSRDVAAVGVGVAVTAPALLLAQGHSASETEYAQVQGARIAVDRAASAKDCAANWVRRELRATLAGGGWGADEGGRE